MKKLLWLLRPSHASFVLLGSSSVLFFFGKINAVLDVVLMPVVVIFFVVVAVQLTYGLMRLFRRNR